MFPWTHIALITPADLYYHNGDTLMLISSISASFALIVSWLLCSTETNYYVYFLWCVGGVVWTFSTAPECQAIVYNNIGAKGADWLPSSVVYCTLLLHSSAGNKKMFKICCHQVTDVPDEVIGRLSGFQGTDASPWIYSIDCCVVVASPMVLTMITQGISRQHQLHRPISVTSWAWLFSPSVSRTKWHF